MAETSELDRRLGTLENDVHSLRAEFRTGMAEFRSGMEQVSKAVEGLRIAQAGSTSFGQVAQGALTMLGIVTVIAGFVIFSIDARTSEIRGGVEKNEAAVQKLEPRIAAIAAQQSVLQSRITSNEKLADEVAYWVRRRHRRANAFYEKVQLGDWEATVKKR